MRPPRQIMEAYQVFTPTQPARANYVERAAVSGQLVDALRTPGKQVVVFGESGAGKTSLLTRKLHELYPSHLTSRCHASMSFDHLVLDAFDQLGAYYLSEFGASRSSSRSASLAADFKVIRGSIDASSTSQALGSQRRVVPPQLTVQRLADFLGASDLCWVIDDFHKIPASEKSLLSQALKVFSDASTDHPSVKIVAIGATDTAREVVEYDREMAHRVAEISVPLMMDHEILSVVLNGAHLLNVRFSDPALASIVEYSTGIPSTCHQIALNACLAYDLHQTFYDVREPRRSFVIDEPGFVIAIERYVRDFADSYQAVFDRVLRCADQDGGLATQVLRALALAPLRGLTVPVLHETVRGELDESVDNVRSLVDDMSEERNGGILRTSPDHRVRFVDALHHGFARASLLPTIGARYVEGSRRVDHAVSSYLAAAGSDWTWDRVALPPLE